MRDPERAELERSRRGRRIVSIAPRNTGRIIASRIDAEAIRLSDSIARELITGSPEPED